MTTSAILATLTLAARCVEAASLHLCPAEQTPHARRAYTALLDMPPGTLTALLSALESAGQEIADMDRTLHAMASRLEIRRNMSLSQR
jgi:hypothetical protein